MGENFVKSKIFEKSKGENFIESMCENFAKVCVKKDRLEKYG